MIVTTRTLPTWLTSGAWIAVGCVALTCVFLLGIGAHPAHVATVPTSMGQTAKAMQATQPLSVQQGIDQAHPFDAVLSSSPVTSVSAQRVAPLFSLALPTVYWRDGHTGRPVQNVPKLQPFSWCSGVFKGKFC